MLAKSYLSFRLETEIETIKKRLYFDPTLLKSADAEILEELFEWLTRLLASLQERGPVPEIRERIEPFVRFIDEHGSEIFASPDVREEFLRTNRQLYEGAMETVSLFAAGEYLGSVLAYIESMAQFLKMTTLLLGLFLEEELLSVFLDPVTLLSNRFELSRDLERYAGSYLMLLNINAFSKLNLLYGYEVGDRVLRQIGDTLRESEAKKSYRIYGDVFAVLFENEAQIRGLFERLNHSVSVLAGEDLYDLYFYGAYQRFESRALENCEFALQHGEQKGLIDSAGNESLVANLQDELDLAQTLRTALIGDRIEYRYQPIFDLKHNGVAVYEMLLRIRTSEGVMGPGEFLEFLYRLPYYPEFTRHAMEKGFEVFKDREEHFAINVTMRDIRSEEIALRLSQLCERHPETVRQLVIEIVESDELTDYETINRFIARFRPYGMRFALDDFGSGYSNFAQCARLEWTISRSTVRSSKCRSKSPKSPDCSIRSWNSPTISG